MRSIRCILRGHARDGNTIRRIEGSWTALCRHCRTPLYRAAPKLWHELPSRAGAPVGRAADEPASGGIEPVEAVALRMALMMQQQEIRRFGADAFADRDYFLDLYRSCLNVARGQAPDHDTELLLLDRVAPSGSPLLLTRQVAA